MARAALGFYYHAINERDRRWDVQRLERQLRSLDAELATASDKRRRRILNKRRMLDHHLRNAAVIAGLDWKKEEADFIEALRSRGPIPEDVPDQYERWRAQGIPPRVLLQAGLRPTRRVRRPVP